MTDKEWIEHAWKIYKKSIDTGLIPAKLCPDMINTKTFALAGNATFTVTSRKTGTRFTFKVRQINENGPHFVKVMTGADNENSYTFLGTIFNGSDFRHGKKSPISTDAPSALAFNYIWKHIDNPPADKIEIHHAGKCCRCGRTLTVPESIESGVGPECAQHLGIA